MARRNSSIGLVLFGLYATCYATFVLVNAYAAHLMEWEPIAGLNLALLSGFGLILLALVLALFYGVIANSAADVADGASSAEVKE